MAEDLLARLIEAIEAHYQERDAPPLLLSRFGQIHGELLHELKAAYGTLSAAAAAAGEHQIKIVRHQRGQEVLAPADRAENISVKVVTESAQQRDSSSRFNGLPRSVQIAFCLRTESDEVVALRTISPWDYRKESRADLVRPGYRIIPDEYRRPGLALNQASLQELEALWKAFLAWTAHEKLDPASFKPSRGGNALARLIAAQPADIIARLVIPADIADLLLRRS
ncbi:hypothetical protein D3C80_357330 [compost metagenome]